MNWYKEYQTEWKEIIETVARELGRSEQMVEKDTIQSMFLFELAKAELPFVFKGGTSLTKAYNLIDRFSEDIDLSVNRRPMQSERVKSKELIIEIAENLGLVLSNPEEIKSRYDYNKYVFKYESLFSVIPLEIIIETSYYQSVYPVEKHVVGSFVGKFCLDRNIILPVSFEAAEVMMNVQSIERTFVDKVFAVCDYDKYKWIINLSGKEFDEAKDMDSEIQITRVLSFEEARAWRKLSGDYVRNRQWNDIEVDIRII